MEIGLGKGKKSYDKRESIKERETDRDIKRKYGICLLYTSDAADERSSVDLGGRRIIKKKKTEETGRQVSSTTTECTHTKG